jgi:phenylacetate-CoA oxygenase PaaJ subunit
VTNGREPAVPVTNGREPAPRAATGVALAVEGLAKTYRAGLRMKRVRALADVSFQVQRGEIFGFVGPNGAGKTTTIRALMGLIRPSAGRCVALGERVPSRKARERIGFLPESPYFYEYLTAREMLDLAGRLFGLDRATRRARAGELVERVGLAGAADRPLRKFSKGMLQRAGLAQALMNRPELVVLDEPMSGLDPVGRKDVRELIREAVSERAAAVAPSAELDVVFVFDPPWTSEWISPAGRAHLAAAGIAPPIAGPADSPIALDQPVPCPFCGSRRTRLENAFGPTLCRAIRWCPDCRQPFEQTKAV